MTANTTKPCCAKPISNVADMLRLLTVPAAILFITLGGWTLLTRDAEGRDERRSEDHSQATATAKSVVNLHAPTTVLPPGAPQQRQVQRVAAIPHPAENSPVAAVSEKDPEPVVEAESSIQYMDAEDEQFAKQGNHVCKNCVSDALSVQSMLRDLCNETQSLRNIMQTEPFFAFVMAYRQLGGDMVVLNEEMAGNVNCEDRLKWMADIRHGISIRLAAK